MPRDAQIAALMWDQFAAMGDINRDGYIDQKDAILLQKAWQTTLADPNWNPAADLNKDGIVDIFDSQILGSHLGLNIWAYFGIPKPRPVWVYALAAGLITLTAVGVGYYALKRRK